MASSTASSSSSLHRCHQSGRSRCSTPTETSSRPRSSRGAQTLNIASLLLLAGQVATAAAKYQCFTNLGSYYPYCVNVPDSASSSDQLPVILMLSGSGARNSGDSSNVKSLVSWHRAFFFDRQRQPIGGREKLVNSFSRVNTPCHRTVRL